MRKRYIKKICLFFMDKKNKKNIKKGLQNTKSCIKIYSSGEKWHKVVENERR